MNVRHRAREAASLLAEAARDWDKDNAPRLGAALAYYTLFSIAPLLVVAIAVAGLAFGQEAAQGRIVAELSGLLGEAGRARPGRDSREQPQGHGGNPGHLGRARDPVPGGHGRLRRAQGRFERGVGHSRRTSAAQLLRRPPPRPLVVVRHGAGRGFPAPGVARDQRRVGRGPRAPSAASSRSRARSCSTSTPWPHSP